MKTNKSRYLEPDVLELVELNYLTKSDSDQRRYWVNRIINRVNELKPLITECIEKDVSLQNLDNDIINEWNQLIILRNKYCL